jgi:hypothetical protein
MLIRNGEIRGADINFTDKSDVLGPFKSCFFCSFQFANPRVFLVSCTINNPMGALSVTDAGTYGTNSRNKALHIIDPRQPFERDLDYMNEKGIAEGNIDPAEWVIVSGMTFDFCFFPVKIFGRNCEIVYSPPALSRNMFTLDEWRRVEVAYKELGISLTDDKPIKLKDQITAELNRQQKRLRNRYAKAHAKRHAGYRR